MTHTGRPRFPRKRTSVCLSRDEIQAKDFGRKGSERNRIRIPRQIVALGVASSPYNKGPTKLIEAQRNVFVEGI